MTQPPEPALDAPPRRAHFRRPIHNLRRGYSTVFILVIAVFAGWAALDAYGWHDLPPDRRILAIAFGLGALLAFLIWRLVDRPLRRELGLARHGEAARAQIVSLRKSRGRRPVVFVTYSFRTATGETLTAECRLPRRLSAESLVPGMALDVLYDAKNPRVNRPRMALISVEFTRVEKPGTV